MSIESNHTCDECRGSIEEGEVAYCGGCFDSLKDEIDNLMKEIENLQEDLVSTINK